MKRITSIILMLMLSNLVSSQTTTINKLFGDTAIFLYGGISIASFNDSIYFSLFEQGQPDNYQATTFVKTDPNGNQITYNRFYQANYYYSSGVSGSLHMTSDGYLICGGNAGSLVTQGDSGVFFKFDRATLDTVFIKHYSHGNISGFYGCGELSDRGYLFSGEAGDTSIHGGAPAWLVRTDSAGTELWQKTMSSDDYSGAYLTYPFFNGFYQLWGTSHPNTASGNSVDSAIFVDKYDNNGNLIWRDTFGVVGNDNTPGPLTGLRDGGGIIALNILDTISPFLGTGNMPGVIYKFDSNGSIEWQRYIPPRPKYLVMNSIVETKSGDLVICGEGYGTLTSIDTTVHDGGCILKLDKNGNTIFYEVYDYDSTWDDVLNDITETSDGGYACIGNAYEHVGNNNYERAWLLKVDSNGCLNGNCPTIETGIKPIPDLINFFVFPNPASSVFTVALAGPNDIYQYHDLKFSLYDLTGRLVTEQSITVQTTVIQRGDLADGLYMWSLSEDGNQLRNGKMVFK